MDNRNNDFLRSLKVSDVGETNIIRETLYSDRDVYTCLKLMADTGKTLDFLVSVSQQEVDDEKISTDNSANYYYVLNAQLGHAEYDYREGRIDGTEFNSKINEACKEHNLDFKYLMEITEKIDSLLREPNQQNSIELAQEIEARAVEELEKRTNIEKI